jgi:hypothetical protein
MAPGKAAKTAVASDFNALINAGKTRRLARADILIPSQELTSSQIVNAVRTKLSQRRFSAKAAEPVRQGLV